MSSTNIRNFTLEELRQVCDVQGIPSSGTKPDLEIRLEEFFRTASVDPANIRASSLRHTPPRGGVERIGTSLTMTDAGPAIDNIVDQPPANDLLEHSRFQSTSNPLDESHTNNVDFFKTAAAQLSTLRQSIGLAPDNTSIESRLSALEMNMTRFFEEQRRFMAGSHRVDLDMPSLRQE